MQLVSQQAPPICTQQTNWIKERPSVERTTPEKRDGETAEWIHLDADCNASIDDESLTADHVEDRIERTQAFDIVEDAIKSGTILLQICW